MIQFSHELGPTEIMNALRRTTLNILEWELCEGRCIFKLCISAGFPSRLVQGQLVG